MAFTMSLVESKWGESRLPISPTSIGLSTTTQTKATNEKTKWVSTQLKLSKNSKKD
jgi:hypothetical protein